MEKNVSLETIQTRHSSRYAMNAIKKAHSKKKIKVYYRRFGLHFV